MNELYRYKIKEIQPYNLSTVIIEFAKESKKNVFYFLYTD
jgi:hypothetical protein